MFLPAMHPLKLVRKFQEMLKYDLSARVFPISALTYKPKTLLTFIFFNLTVTLLITAISFTSPIRNQ